MALSSRLFVAFAVLALVVVLVMAWVVQTLVSGLFVDYLNVTRPWQAAALEGPIAEAYGSGGWPAVQAALESTSDSGAGNTPHPMHGHHGPPSSAPGSTMARLSRGTTGLPPVAITDTDGVVRASTANIEPGTVIDRPALDAAYQLEHDSRVFGLLVFNPDQLAEVSPIVRFLSPLLGAGPGQVSSSEEAYRVAVGRATWFTAILAVGLAALSGWWVSRRLGRPLNALAAGADRFAGGDLDYTIDVGQGEAPEVRRVATALNGMAGKISGARERERQLFADIAHELRTPLTIMRGQLDSLQESASDSSERAILSVQDEVLRLSRLVSDLGQLSLVDVGKLPLKKEAVSVRDVVVPVVEGFGPEAEARGISLEWTTAGLDDSVHDRLLHVDRVRIKQVLANLAGNALRHTPRGGQIHIEHRVVTNQLEVSVSDNGDGIGPEALAHVFDRFYRADSSRARETGGTGLGLAIARGYIEAHGGTIHAESSVGEGTTLSFRLPLETL